ncbi:unnamed protein product [Heligmosomoides polygyrus]|uniref:Uncharacterized protein n=1 Tax=Heligmosomoides polygyrus TaxID=6339 RepID=A0A183FXM5_HELPZ|nr:unnamed protein product [Heligmosomoides polygyrus]
MISPQTIIKPTSQIKLDDSPLMELDAARKTSDKPLLTSIQHRPFQGKKHQNIATRKASLMAQKRASHPASESSAHVFTKRRSFVLRRLQLRFLWKEDLYRFGFDGF